MLKLTVLCLLLLVHTAHAQSQFEGDLVLEPPGCEHAGKCTLKNKLRFIDSSNVVWEAAAGLETDGASIPSFFQPFVGKPFESAFVRAAVVHDHYCVRHVRPWRATHRVFYEGLLDQGVSSTKAKLMYYAVYLGGPKWVKLVPGLNCGKNCINKLTTVAGTPVFNSKEADYALFDMDAELKALEVELISDPTNLSLDDLEKRAQKRRPNDYYYRNGDTVPISDFGITE